jgi:hypothetical protein
MFALISDSRFQPPATARILWRYYFLTIVVRHRRYFSLRESGPR